MQMPDGEVVGLPANARNLDGSARSPTAVADDFALEKGVELCERLSRVVPTALFTIENPVNDVFPFLPVF